MPDNTAAQPVTPTSLLDDVMGIFARGERAVFADLGWTAMPKLPSLSRDDTAAADDEA